MKKKRLLLFLIVNLFSVISILFVACGEHKHTFSEEWSSDSYYHWRSATCEHSNEVVSRAEHKWDSGKVTVEATCDSVGIKTYMCTDCGKTKTESIEKVSHTYAEEWSSDSYYHWRSATCEHSNKAVSRAEHKWDSGKVTVEATCDTEGVKTYTCTDCGQTKNISIAKLTEHKWNIGEITVPATCTTQGVKTFVCNECGEEKHEIIKDTGHSWDEGTITTNPTCLTLGLITFTCTQCSETKKEIVDANEKNHIYGNYEIDETHHWQTCRLCGNILKENHGFEGASKNSDVESVLACECGIYKTVGEFYSCKVTFGCGDGVSVLVYETQDYTAEGLASTVAYSRNGDTGELLNNGDGQVNFEVVVALGYKLKNITISQKNYKNLKDPSETGKDNTYRITKITGELGVTIETEIDFLELPVLVINTENSAPILDKENYVNCKVSVFNAEEEYCFESAGAGIRGRGNYTWTEAKKPYKLKFDSKIDLFGNGKAKKWTLIANHYDFSLIRNYLTFLIGTSFDSLSDTTTSVQFIDLYLNGEYEGVYLVCEQNEVGKTRVDIEDDFSVATTPEEMGFLLELDGRAPDEGIEDLDYIRVNGQCYAIKSPDYEDIHDEAVKYSEYVSFIKNYLENICNTLKNNEDYSQIQELLDIDSFADSYILNELVKSGDIGQLSFYIYRNNTDGKLYCGPVWDYDVAIGNCTWADCVNYNVLYAKRENFYYRTLLEYDEFVDLVAQKLSANYEKVRNIVLDGINNIFDNYCCAFLRNFERWDVLVYGTNAPHTDELAAIKSWEGQVEYVKEWLLNSLDYIMSVYCS